MPLTEQWHLVCWYFLSITHQNTSDHEEEDFTASTATDVDDRQRREHMLAPQRQDKGGIIKFGDNSLVVPGKYFLYNAWERFIILDIIYSTFTKLTDIM